MAEKPALCSELSSCGGPTLEPRELTELLRIVRGVAGQIEELGRYLLEMSPYLPPGTFQGDERLIRAREILFALLEPDSLGERTCRASFSRGCPVLPSSQG